MELAKLAAKVGFKELRSGDMKSRLEQAALIVSSLSKLKGAAMKAGQLLSIDLQDYFPPEAIEILSQLQNAAVAHPYSEIEKVLRKELGEKKFKKLEAISPTPIGVASIGQVHRARYQGEEIVLKVQYAGVATSIKSDLKILKGIAVSFCQLSGRRMDLEPLFAEFRRILESEVDYAKEAEFQKEYRERVSQLRSGGYALRVPEVKEEISTKRVLAMSFEEGVSLREWLKSGPSMKKREKLATAILDLYFHEFFEWSLVQTDPNWGNFLVDESGKEPALVLLDFGASRRYSRKFIKDYIRLLDFAARGESKALREFVVKIGLLDPRESPAALEVFENLIKTAIRPFFEKDAKSGRFDFTDQSHIENSHAAGKALAAALIYSPPPYSLVFLHRKLAGVYSILKNLGVHLDVSGYWQKMHELSKIEE